MTRADALDRCLWTRPDGPLGRVVAAVREWRAAGLFAHPAKGQGYWREEILTLVSRLYDPEDLLAACLVAVEQGVADAGTVYDRSPVPGFRR